MAKDPQVKKSKVAATEIDTHKSKAIKKTKSVVADGIEGAAKKRKATEDAAPVKVKKTKTPEADADVEENDDTAAPTEKVNGNRASTRVKKAPVKDIPTEVKPKKAATKVTKVTKEKIIEAEAADNSEDDSEADSEVDDQTIELLKGFESDGDEDEAEGEGFTSGQVVPDRKKLSKAEEKKLKEIAKAAASDKPGVVYVGRIPHGFFEHEMKAYFSQFGTILKLRLSRNRKTGASKHHAWVQFESASVAEIVAKAMDNYLMFGHLLKVKVVPDEAVPADLFKGANKRFKNVPWNKIQGRKIAQGQSEEVWDERKEREEKRRQGKAEKMKAIGYEFEAPKLESAKGVAKKFVPAIESAAEALAIEAAPATEEAIKPKKKVTKKSSKADLAKDVEMADAEDKIEEPVKPAKKVAKKTTKVVVEEDVETVNGEDKAEEAVKPTKKVTKKVTKVVTEEPVEEPTKGKKGKAVDEVDEEVSVPATEAAVLKKGKKAKKVVEEEVVATEVVPEVESKKAKKPKKGKTVEVTEVVEEAVIPEVTETKKPKKAKAKKVVEAVEDEAVEPVVEEIVAKKGKANKKRKADDVEVQPTEEPAEVEAEATEKKPKAKKPKKAKGEKVTA